MVVGACPGVSGIGGEGREEGSVGSDKKQQRWLVFRREALKERW